MSNKDRIILKRLMKSATENMCISFFDDFVEENTKQRLDMGLRAVIIRQELSSCCNWCKSLVGIYDYSNAPKDIFKRHDNCKCMVTYRTEKGYTDVWSKKTFNSHREARIEAIKTLSEPNEELDELRRRRRKAKSERKKYIETTDLRLKHKKPKGEVRETDFFIHDKKKYKVDGKHVIQDHSKYEVSLAEALIENIGGNIEILPRILEPNYIKCCDYSINGIKYELKSPGIDNYKINIIKPPSKNTIRNSLQNAKGQAENIILDISFLDINDGRLSEILNECRKSFEVRQRDFIESIIVMYKNKVIYICERA